MSGELGRFKEECLENGENPDTIRIEGTNRKDEVERLKNQSRYHEKDAKELLEGGDN